MRGRRPDPITGNQDIRHARQRIPPGSLDRDDWTRQDQGPGS
jgi:hypothetical protein